MLKLITEIKEKLINWEENSTKREKVLVLVLSVLVPSFLFYKFIYIPFNEKIYNLRNEIKNLELEISKLESLVKKEKEMDLQYQKRREFLEEIKNILPTEKEIPELLKSISENAKKNKLEIIKFSPVKEEKRDYYDLIAFNMELRGYFHDLIKFINDITKMPRLVNIDEVEFVPQQKDEKIILKVNFNTYKYTGVKSEQKK